MADAAQAESTGPDAAGIVADEWPERALPHVLGTRNAHFQAVVRRSVLDAIHGHGKSLTDVEVCGVLVGNVYHDETGPYLHISNCIRGDHAAGHAAQVTFTAATWAAIQATMDRDYSNLRIVGWYHTHPNFGIFLSGMDLFIQNHFFNLPWQVAFVYDPISGEEGMFFWNHGKTERQEFLIEEDEAPRDLAPTLAETEAAERVAHAAVTGVAPLATPASSAPEVKPAQTSGLFSPEPEPEQSAPPPYFLDPIHNPWAGTRAAESRHIRIPLWLIATVAFVLSFGATVWVMFFMQPEVVTLPHPVDHSASPPSITIPSGKPAPAMPAVPHSDARQNQGQGPGSGQVLGRKLENPLSPGPEPVDVKMYGLYVRAVEETAEHSRGSLNAV